VKFNHLILLLIFSKHQLVKKGSDKMQRNKRVKINFFDIDETPMSNQDAEIIKNNRKKIMSLESILTLVIITYLSTSLVTNFEYSEYVQLITSIICIASIVYVVVTRKSCKNRIRKTLTPYLKEKNINDESQLDVISSFEKINKIIIFLITISSLFSFLSSIFKIVI